MSLLQDESFPTDELIDQLTPPPARRFQHQFSEHHQPEAFERNASPFLNSDCSEEDVANKSAKTCVSDPVGLEQEHDDDAELENGGGLNVNGQNSGQAQLGHARSSKAVSYQDIHSAYTKRRFRHVPSKVGKYIADMQAEDKLRRLANIQRHSSMPECFMPKTSNAPYALHSNMSDSGSTGHTDQSFERAIEERKQLQQDKNRLEDEKERLQSFAEHQQVQLNKKRDELILMRRNFDAIRQELTECKEKLKKQQAPNLRSLMYCAPALIAKGTQTEAELAAPNSSQISNLLDMPAVPITPHPQLNNLTFVSSAGSMEVALLSVAPARTNANTKPNPRKRNIQPLSLNFSQDSVDNNGNAVAGTSQPGSSNRTENSHPSSNDSAIEVEGCHELPSPCRRQARSSTTSFAAMGEGVFYFDKCNNRVIELGNLLRLNPTSNHNNNNSESQQSSSMLLPNAPTVRQRPSLGSRMLRLFGPCARCHDNNQSVNASSATYIVGLPLLNGEEYARNRNSR